MILSSNVFYFFKIWNLIYTIWGISSKSKKSILFKIVLYNYTVSYGENMTYHMLGHNQVLLIWHFKIKFYSVTEELSKCSFGFSFKTSKCVSSHIKQNLLFWKIIIILNRNPSVIHQCHELDNSELLTCSLSFLYFHVSTENKEHSRMFSWTVMNFHP